MKNKVFLAFLGIVILSLHGFSIVAQDNRTFVHPGTLHTTESLNYIKDKIAKQENPWYKTFLMFKNYAKSRKQYQSPGATRIATRDKAYSDRDGVDYKYILESDSYAIYCQALMWKLTGDNDYALNAINILNDWSSTLEEVVGADIELTVGFNAYFMAIGAELMMDYTGWTQDDIDRCKTMFREIWYPHIKKIERINGQGTWDSASAKCVLAMAVFLEDWTMFGTAIDYFYNGNGNGTVNYYFKETGQSQESGRKQGYAQLGLSNFEEWCEIAYNQGFTDLWDARDYIICKSFEYHAKYNLGEEVPFETFIGRYPGTTFTSISDDGRGQFKPIYYMAYNHFYNRMKVEMPYVKRVIDDNQTIEQTHQTITDGAGWGSLFFYTPGLTPTGITNISTDANYEISLAADGILINNLNKTEKVSVYDITGKLVRKYKAVDDELHVSLFSGIYLVQIDLNGKYFTYKIAKL